MSCHRRAPEPRLVVSAFCEYAVPGTLDVLAETLGTLTVESREKWETALTRNGCKPNQPDLLAALASRSASAVRSVGPRQCLSGALYSLVGELDRFPYTELMQTALELDPWGDAQHPRVVAHAVSVLQDCAVGLYDILEGRKVGWSEEELAAIAIGALCDFAGNQALCEFYDRPLHDTRLVPVQTGDPWNLAVALLRDHVVGAGDPYASFSALVVLPLDVRRIMGYLSEGWESSLDELIEASVTITRAKTPEAPLPPTSPLSR